MLLIAHSQSGFCRKALTGSFHYSYALIQLIHALFCNVYRWLSFLSRVHEIPHVFAAHFYFQNY